MAKAKTTDERDEREPAASRYIVKTTVRDAIATVDVMIAKQAAELLPLMSSPGELERLRSLTAHALADPKLAAKIIRADLATVYLAVRECASLGLMPIPTLAEAYFVPYWNRDKGLYDLELQAGWQGLAKLVRNSGRVVDIGAGVAYDGDEFDYDEGSAAFVHHKRALRDRGDRLAAYAIAWLPAGVVRVRVMDMAEIETHRAASKADSGPWVDWYDAMSTKTVLRDLAKQLPKSATVERALMLDSDAEDRHDRPPGLPAPRPSSSLGRIQRRLGLPDAEAGPAEAGVETGAPASEPGETPDVVAEVLELFEGEVVSVSEEPSEGTDTPSNAGVHI